MNYEGSVVVWRAPGVAGSANWHPALPGRRRGPTNRGIRPNGGPALATTTMGTWCPLAGPTLRVFGTDRALILGDLFGLDVLRLLVLQRGLELQRSGGENSLAFGKR